MLTLVVLADDRPNWRISHYEEEVLGCCRVRFDFPVCKLLDLVERAQAAASKGLPSAVIIAANWAAQNTRQDPNERLRWKWDLTRQLYEAGVSRADILKLYRLIDWLLRLPEGLEQEFKQRVVAYEESKSMPYVTSIERLAKAEGEACGEARGEARGRAEGEAHGRTEGTTVMILRQLRRRWGGLSQSAEARIRALPEERLVILGEALLDFNAPADLEAWLDSH